MANHMRCYLQIGGLNEAGLERLKEIFCNDEKENNWGGLSYAEKVVMQLYPEYNPETDCTIGWWGDNLGSKWVQFEYHFSKKETYEEDAVYEIQTTSAWSVPVSLLEKIVEDLCKVSSDVYISGTYEDEYNDPMGAFLFANDYDDIEDLELEIDGDKFWEDDDYRDEIYSELDGLRQDLYDAYCDYLIDRDSE